MLFTMPHAAPPPHTAVLIGRFQPLHLGHLALLQQALAFCDQQAFEATQLWTFSGLDAARRLYESSGFTLAEEWPGQQWGETVTEQRFVRARP